MVMIPVSTLNALSIKFGNQDIIQYEHGLGVWNSSHQLQCLLEHFQHYDGSIKTEIVSNVL
jgi:hypothetical protein